MEYGTMRLKRPALRRARIEIIPMIDTIFFLLVFFMITWLSMVKMNGMGLSLPRENRTGGPAPVSVTLSISPTGRYYVDTAATPAAGWMQALRARLIGHPNSVVVLNVAATQKTQTLIALMDAVNGVIAPLHSHTQVIIATPRIAEHAPQEAAHAFQ
jgi:biopolymer transport protein ExbD